MEQDTTWPSTGANDDIRLTPRQCECWSCKANREPTEADAIDKATCTCHIDDGPACPVHVASVCETDGQQA